MTPEGGLHTALVVAVPEAARVVDGWRERTSEAKPSAGVPAHVTVLSPFVAPSTVDEPLLEDLRALISAFERFTFSLDAIARFASLLYLVPRPAEPFARLTGAVWRAYPDYPPYGGDFDTVIQHLTAAEGEQEVLDEAEADIRRSLPITAQATEVVLLEELEPSSARWRARDVLPLGDACEQS